MEDKPVHKWIQPIFLTGILLFLLYGLNNRIGPIPPLGKLFNPFSGFWRNAETEQTKDLSLCIPGLQETVSIVYDKRAVPHLFAQNSHDLYLAQGYVTARDRLWQMEIQAQSAAGRLAEFLGPAFVEHDRTERRLGIPQAAEKDLALMMKDSEARDAAVAYSDGVNAYIHSLSKSTFPIEYKLLDYAPQIWSPINTVLMIKNMQSMLSRGSEDVPLSNTLSKFGIDFIRKFYPTIQKDVEPVIPRGTAWNFLAPAPKVPKMDSAAPHSLFPGIPDPPLSSKSAPVPVQILKNRPDPGNGSNNFVLSGAKTRGRYPILANDPHLELGLPSLWYEIQLSAPGIGVYGVSLPCIPGILIGFNRHIAWGMTNGSDDVFDWYRTTFKDSTLSEYIYAGKWQPTRKDVQLIKVRGENPIFDTVLFTHQGPLVLKSQERPMNRNTPSLHVLHWLALDPSDELLSILHINKATSFNEFATALTPFQCPSQNFAFASVNGDIGMFHQGRFPRKWNGQGRFILDGSEPGNDWSGWIAESESPRIKNPSQGWLYSANQSPTDSTYPYFLGNQFQNGVRARRLAQMLAVTQNATPENAFAMMLDDFDLHAFEILPFLLQKLVRSRLSSQDSTALKLLKAWNYRDGSTQVAPTLFNLWWQQLYQAIWHDEFGDDSLQYQWPSQDRTQNLIMEDEKSDWFDDISTPAKETLDFLITRSFREALELSRLPSKPKRDTIHFWKSWSTFRPVAIPHLAHIDAFSRLKISTGGCATCVNAMKPTHGPSWRMVVALDKMPRGRGIYPGGQSGNPGSPHYDDFISDWAAGRSYELNFLTSPGLSTRKSFSLQLRSK